MTDYWPLLGVAVVVLGFALRQNPILVVITAALVSGFAARRSPDDLLAMLGTAFIKNRQLAMFVLILPVIGVLERAGLRERARTWILGFARLTLAQLLIAYLALRQVLSMIGLYSIGGPAQTVRPLVAPMAEATAAQRYGALDDSTRDEIRALAAATDNVGMFFGEDVFLAFGAVLLIRSFYADQGIALDATAIAIWAAPTAVAAFVVHSIRVIVYQVRLARRLRGERP